MKKNDEAFEMFEKGLKELREERTLQKCECGGEIIKDNQDYYCESCKTEYEKCPSCNELVPEEIMTYHYEDRVCEYCIRDGYGE